MITEADEPLVGLGQEEAKELARTNLIEKWIEYRRGDETMAVVEMYAGAARGAGLDQDEIDAILRRGRHGRGTESV